VRSPFDILTGRVDALSRDNRAHADALATIRETAEAAHRTLDDLVDRVAAAEHLAAGTAAQLAKQAGVLTGDPGEGISSWLAAPRPAALAELVVWIGQVLIHYPGTADALSTCWPYHPWIVEELLALHAAWIDAYEGDRPSGTKAVDWHDRHHPGALTRIATELRDCSIDAHRPGGRVDHTQLPATPATEHVSDAGAWWTNARKATAQADRDT
jgi:hypothetical protein